MAGGIAACDSEAESAHLYGLKVLDTVPLALTLNGSTNRSRVVSPQKRYRFSGACSLPVMTRLTPFLMLMIQSFAFTGLRSWTQLMKKPPTVLGRLRRTRGWPCNFSTFTSPGSAQHRVFQVSNRHCNNDAVEGLCVTLAGNPCLCLMATCFWQKQSC